MILTVELSKDQAWAIAQFFKRAGFSDYRANAVDDDEAYEMRDAADVIRNALSEHGIAPR